jgi:hypothetical protein
MRHDTFQQAARAAFSLQDWLLLLDDAVLRERFSTIETIQDVEIFVFDAYDRLRTLRRERAALNEEERSLPALPK